MANQANIEPDIRDLILRPGEFEAVELTTQVHSFIQSVKAHHAVDLGQAKRQLNHVRSLPEVPPELAKVCCQFADPIFDRWRGFLVLDTLISKQSNSMPSPLQLATMARRSGKVATLKTEPKPLPKINFNRFITIGKTTFDGRKR